MPVKPSNWLAAGLEYWRRERRGPGGGWLGCIVHPALKGEFLQILERGGGPPLGGTRTEISW